jgi:hypothetical protein
MFPTLCSLTCQEVLVYPGFVSRGIISPLGDHAGPEVVVLRADVLYHVLHRSMGFKFVEQ